MNAELLAAVIESRAVWHALEYIARGAPVEPPAGSATTPLVEAAREGLSRVVAALLARGASVETPDRLGRTPLLHAVGYGHRAVVRQLVAAGADVNARDPAGGGCMWPLLIAVYRGESGLVRDLLRAGADPKAWPSQNISPLVLAACGGSTRIVDLLLQYGAEVNTPSHTGMYAITLAVFPLYSFLYRHVSGFSKQDVIRDLVADGEYLLWGPVVFLGRL